MRLPGSLAIFACVVLLVAPQAGAAEIPPDNSAADEYTEGVPGAQGNTPSTEEGGGLPDSANDALDSLGPAGAEAAAVLGSSAPPGSDGGGKSDDGSFAAGPASEEGGVGDTVGSALGSSSGGMGLLLPIILALALAGGVGLAIARRRSGRTAAG